MSRYDSRCAFCRDVAARDLVAAAIRAGERPAAILQRYGDSLPGSSSSLYRHVRGHLDSVPFVPRWIDGDATTTDLVSGLAQLRSSLLEQRQDALARSQHSAAAQIAARLESVTVSLLKEAHLTDTEQARLLQYADRIGHSFVRAAFRSPEVADAIAFEAHHLGYLDLAADADQLAADVRAQTTH